MKKTMSMLLAFILVAVIAGCGGKTAQPAATTPESVETAQPTATTPKPVETAQPTASPGAPKYGGVLKLIITQDISYPFGLPWNAQMTNASQILVPFAETLVLERTNGEISPWLAESYEIDVEKAEIRFKLREDVYFTDGSKLNADVVEWNFDQFKKGKQLPATIDRGEKRGEYEFAIVMKDGVFANNVLNFMAARGYAIISKENYEKNGEEYAGEHPVGTGPFIMTEKVPGVKVVFTRNENYWQKGKPYLDGIEYHAITDLMTQNAAMLTKGDDRIDVLNTAIGEQLSLLDADPDLTAYSFPNGVMAIYPSSRDESSPFFKQEVREAISYAINRQDIADAKGFGFIKPATQLITKGYFGHFNDERNYFSYDLAKAKELMAEAGYPDGFETSFYAATNTDKDVCVAIIDMLEQIGIKCTLEIREPASMSELRTNGWDGLLYQAFGNLASLPGMFRLNFDPAYLFNPSTWRPPGYEADFIKLSQTKTFDQSLAEKAHSWIVDYMCVIPVLETINAYVVRDSVKDGEFGQWALGTQWLPHNVWIDE